MRERQYSFCVHCETRHATDHMCFEKREFEEEHRAMDEAAGTFDQARSVSPLRVVNKEG